MKRIILTLISLFAVCFFTSCEKPVEPKKPVLPPIEEPLPNFQGTYWKLAGYFEETGDTLYQFKLQECDSSYYFIFGTDSTASGRVVSNYLRVRLLAERPIYISTLAMDGADGELFREITEIVTTWSYDIDKLKFICKDRSYLLFERR